MAGLAVGTMNYRHMFHFVHCSAEFHFQNAPIFIFLVEIKLWIDLTVCVPYSSINHENHFSSETHQ